MRDPADRSAWNDFEHRYGPLIVGYCRSVGLQLADAEDVRQEVMVSLSKALVGFRYDPARGRFRSYLGRAVRNCVSRHLARHTSRPQALLHDACSALVAGSADEEDAQWNEQWVRHHCRLALQSLRQEVSRQQVDVFESLLAGSSVSAAARQFDLTCDAVRKIKQRVRDRLRDIIARQIRDEECADD